MRGWGIVSVKGQDGREIAGMELAPVSQPVASFVYEMPVVWGWMEADLGRGGRERGRQ